MSSRQLIAALAETVPAAIRQRSVAYFRAVEILEGGAGHVQARVQGTDVYEVSLAHEEGVLRALCTCPYFQDRQVVCKHIWATIVVADRHGHLGGPGAGSAFSPEDDGDDGDDEAGYRVLGRGVIPIRRRPGRAPLHPRPRPERWKLLLTDLRHAAQPAGPSPQAGWPPGREILYVLDVSATLELGYGLRLEVGWHERKRDGAWGRLRSSPFTAHQIAGLSEPSDRRILSLLAGAQHSFYYSPACHASGPCCYSLTEDQAGALIPEVCRTGRCILRLPEGAEPRPVHWDEGSSWQLWLEVIREAEQYVVSGWLRRGEERRPLSAPRLLFRGGLVFWDDRAARLQDSGAFGWVALLRDEGEIRVPLAQGDELIQELLAQPRLPALELPEELRVEEVHLPPRPCLKVRTPERPGPGYGRRWLQGTLSHDYDGTQLLATDERRGIYQPEGRRFIVRDRAAEQAAVERLRQLGFQSPRSRPRRQGWLELSPGRLPGVVRVLLEEGWHVEAEGSLYRRSGAFKLEVTSNLDWFDLEGSIDFDGATASLPALLAASKRGEDVVLLDDGSFGVLPEAWLKKYGLLGRLGKTEGDRLRFKRSQVGLLDALLASQPEATWDDAFAHAREELAHFAGIQPLAAAPGFVGELRGYQSDGLGWFAFLRQFGLGGCLADDMGLGKTVQVLALLESRRERGAGPSLVVVPRSLVFNWKQEAARFAPRLRILDHTGSGRRKPGDHFEEHDLVLTTYGTLRRDAPSFKDVSFDYCILDEAQAVKNAATEAAKAVRLLRGKHRLALSGTPVENHLGELWSLFEFLNPGMLGAASVFRLSGTARQPDEETRTVLARALRPFILRRTKAQVARELPPKVEQTLYCELQSTQRQHYDELREHYRRLLLEKVEQGGLNRAKIQVLEALLRLRQAACHPGLIDVSRSREPSAKLDLMLPRLAEVTQAGHKALVFSQFTSLLAIVRDRLDEQGVIYEYLDGRTRDRGPRVERFQNDPDCRLFLISLKAGGLGLNLTAAEYVFLLDPWWNPAVEAQAIDRAHRIGQAQQVFACRLIARDTVEEKILLLQQTKREVADAIISADGSLIRNLTADDLQLLLS